MKVVIIGCGTGGLEFIKEYGRDVTLIEPREKMICQALLPEYIVDKVDEDYLTVDISDFCDKNGVNWIRDKAVRIYGDRVFTENDEIEFDILIVSTGAKPFVFENTFNLGDLKNARNCKKAIESAERVVVIGSGATGVECAFELKEFGLDVTIVEYFERVLPSFSYRVSSFVKNCMEKEGIKVLTSCKVVGVNEFVKTSRGEIDCDLAISCAGVIPNVIDGLKVEEKGIVVDEYLRAKDNIFAIGDCANVCIDGKIATKTAYEAEMQARYTAKNVERLEKGEKLIRYKIHSSLDKPIAFITLAKNRAILIYKGIFIPKPMKLIYRVKKRIMDKFMKRYKY